jgi:hypothetical protein
MIFIKRNRDLISKEVLDAAEQATKDLEALAPEERTDFIEKKKEIWRDFKEYLMEMSAKKCWYSESIPSEHHSRADVDHFRPKARARRSETERDEGYPWLAFDWKNFRYAAQLANQLTKNHETGEVDGKGDWFPLLDSSPRATWDHRCESDEKPVLLDPTVRADIDLIDVRSDGHMECSQFCFGSNKYRVERSIEIYGLNLNDLPAARRRVMREIEKWIEILSNQLEIAIRSSELPVIDSIDVQTALSQIREKTTRSSPFARAARAQLKYMGYPQLGATPEDDASAA